jgi:dinuclear metal center YbgI/SA1388 family protein
MATLADVTAALEHLAPLRLAADWDAVGLLLGSRRPAIDRVMTCLTLTEAVAREAVRERVDLVVSHHPLPFRPVARITDDSPTGRVLLDLLGSGIAVWSSHTAWDSAAGGINDQLAEWMQLGKVVPLEPDPIEPAVGVGRAGDAPAGVSVADLARSLVAALAAADRSVTLTGCQIAGDTARSAGRVGIVCGSGGEMVAAVQAAGCTTLVTGEIKLHDALAALAAGVSVIAVGHHASERFSMGVLATRLAARLPGLTSFASQTDVDPLTWIPHDRLQTVLQQGGS